ncbi:MAG: PD-(D/E)XK motif protein [Defluviitaleaceae bacterium]|nr:PD-(D/E)XK motif protein [Defluviitaleaceae bacterium]
MSLIEQILNRLEEIKSPADRGQFSLFQLPDMDSNIFYGKNTDNQVVFATYSQNSRLKSSLQKTRKLIFWFNAKCDISIDGQSLVNHMNVLTCLSCSESEVTAFIRLTLAFAEGMEEQDTSKLYELFSALTRLFADERKINQAELQGFFGELYIIRHYHELGLNLSDYWQKKEKLNFDFSLSESKKVEIKSTAKEIRVHRFKHEQLLSDLYNICIISIMMRPDDAGLSLYQLISEVQRISSGNFYTLVYIENFIKAFDEDELKSIRYDSLFIERRLRVYRAEDVPRFEDEQPRGVSRTEYDSDLSTSPFMSDSDFVIWARSTD